MKKSLTKQLIKLSAFTAAGIGLGLLLCPIENESIVENSTAEPLKKDTEPLTEKEVVDPSPKKRKVRQNLQRIKSEPPSAELRKWGTTQGIIDVANKTFEKRRKAYALKRMVAVGQQMNKQLASKVAIDLLKEKKPQSTSAFYAALQKHYDVSQVSITNNSSLTRQVRLWGGNSPASVSPPLPDDLDDLTVVGTTSVPLTAGVGVHPVAVAINPRNQLVYVANQLSNNVSVFDQTGVFQRLITLSPSSFPGYNSPVAIAVNSNTLSPNYGKVYVCGSVANTISVIDTNFNVTEEIEVSTRPCDVKFNEVNNLLYVAGYAKGEISVIDTTTETLLTTLAGGANPIGIGISPTSGEVYIADEQSGELIVYDNANNLVATIPGVGSRPSRIIHHSQNNEMWVTSAGDAEIAIINTITHSVSSTIPVGTSPFGIAYNPSNDLVYVGNRADNTYSIVDKSHIVTTTLNLGGVGTGFGFDEGSALLFSADISSNEINIIGLDDESSAIVIDGDYFQKREDFIHNPALVKHVRFILSGADRFKVLTLSSKKVTGETKNVSISFSAFQSPQQLLNVSEVTALEGSNIDGLNSWAFDIGPNQHIGILVYYKQLERIDLLPKRTINY